ncbi:MAG: alkaline phosphatase family protein [Peptococcaceae bacterium]|nr:alkaline phosphatase family protein [Peptococcaceae bacterium]
MAAVNRLSGSVFGFLLVLFLFPGTVLALPPAVREVKPDPPQKSKRVVILVVDGLQADSLSPERTPNISGLGMAGVRADRVSAMPPDNSGARLHTILSGTDPAVHGYNGESAAPGAATLLSRLEKRGVKTAVVDGTGRLEKVCGDVSHKNFGPFDGDGQVMGAAAEVIRTKKPFLTVVVLAGPGMQPARAGLKEYQSSVAAADTEVGKLLKQLHADGIYEDTMLVVTGTTGRPPLLIKGSEFAAGLKMPPVCLKDLAPTLGYLYGVEMPEARGLIMWNALRPAADRTESFMLAQRVRDLSAAYADAVDAAARLENEKILVQEEKARLSMDKQFVEAEIEAREKEIGRLRLTISAMKAAGAAGIILFIAAMVIEYRILKKRYLIFT